MPDQAEVDLRERFKSARAASGLNQEDAAKRLGVSTASVSRKERGEQPVSRRDVAAMETVCDEERQARRLGNVPRRTISNLSESQQVPDWFDLRAEALDRELARLGATDAQLDYIKSLVRSPATLKMVMQDNEGAPRPPADQREQLELFIEGMRFWLERSSTPGGAPVAGVIATQDPAAKSAHHGRRK